MISGTRPTSKKSVMSLGFIFILANIDLYPSVVNF